MKRKIITIAMAMVLCLSLVFSTGAATKLKLNRTKIDLVKGSTFKLKVKGKKIKKKKFKSTNKKVATVSKKGVVTAVNVGTCKIKVVVKLKNKKVKKLTCKVRVLRKKIQYKVEPTKAPSEITKPAETTIEVPTRRDPEDITIQVPTRTPRETTTPAETTEKPTHNLPDIQI